MGLCFNFSRNHLTPKIVIFAKTEQMALYMESFIYTLFEESGNRKKNKQTTRIIKIDIEMLKPQKQNQGH